MGAHVKNAGPHLLSHNFPKISSKFLKDPNKTLTQKKLKDKEISLNSMSSLQCQPYISFLGILGFWFRVLLPDTTNEWLMREKRTAVWGFKIIMTLLFSLIAKKTLFPSIKRNTHVFSSKKLMSSLKKFTLYAIRNDEGYIARFWTWGYNVQNTL